MYGMASMPVLASTRLELKERLEKATHSYIVGLLEKSESGEALTREEYGIIEHELYKVNQYKSPEEEAEKQEKNIMEIAKVISGLSR